MLALSSEVFSPKLQLSYLDPEVVKEPKCSVGAARFSVNKGGVKEFPLEP